MPFVNRAHQLRQRRALQAAATLHDAPGRLPGTLAVVVFHRHQSRHRPAMSGYEQALAASDAVQETGQVGLGFAPMLSIEEDLQIEWY